MFTWYKYSIKWNNCSKNDRQRCICTPVDGEKNWTDRYRSYLCNFLRHVLLHVLDAGQQQAPGGGGHPVPLRVLLAVVSRQADHAAGHLLHLVTTQLRVTDRLTHLRSHVISSRTCWKRREKLRGKSYSTSWHNTPRMLCDLCTKFISFLYLYKDCWLRILSTLIIIGKYTWHYNLSAITP